MQASRNAAPSDTTGQHAIYSDALYAGLCLDVLQSVTVRTSYAGLCFLLQPVKVRTPEERAAARWAAFLEDPDAWLDQRPAKAAGRLSARHPDFVHAADKRRALWLSGGSTPPEVHKVAHPPRKPMSAALRRCGTYVPLARACAAPCGVWKLGHSRLPLEVHVELVL